MNFVEEIPTFIQNFIMFETHSLVELRCNMDNLHSTILFLNWNSLKFLLTIAVSSCYSLFILNHSSSSDSTIFALADCEQLRIKLTLSSMSHRNLEPQHHFLTVHFRNFYFSSRTVKLIHKILREVKNRKILYYI